MRTQNTISKEVTYSGIGLHTGEKVDLKFRPAPPDTGIIFIRTDLPDKLAVPATIDNVIGVFRGTSIGMGAVKIHTIEHVLSALAGLEIDNAYVELNASEPPAGDGSSLPFVETLQKAKKVSQNTPKPIIELKEPIMLSDVNVSEAYVRHIIALPSETLKVSFTIDYVHPAIGTQFAEYELNQRVFLREIMMARTFGFLDEKEKLQKRGLALGANLESAIVIGPNGVMNESLRFKDEFVRHKILDLIGDLFLLQADFKAHIIAIKSGHALNIELARRLKKYISNVPYKGILNGKSFSVKWPEKKTEYFSPIKTEIKIFGNKRSDIMLDVKEIQKILPHRYPFLLVDKIIELEENKRAVGIKNVTFNEPFFTGHFPGHPIMPGVLIIEAMAQVGGVAFLISTEHKGKLPIFVGIDKVRFRRPVVPGDQLRIEINVVKLRGNLGKVEGKAYVDGKVAAEGLLMFTLMKQ